MAGRKAGHFLSASRARLGSECSAQVLTDEGDPFAARQQPEFPGGRIGLHSGGD